MANPSSGLIPTVLPTSNWADPSCLANAPVLPVEITPAGGTAHYFNIVTSSDGITWIPQEVGNPELSNPSATFNGVEWSPFLGFYISSYDDGTGGSGLIFSTDGITWIPQATTFDTLGAIPISFIWIAEWDCFFSFLFSGAVYKSFDGITWTSVSCPVTPLNGAREMAWSPELGMLWVAGHGSDGSVSGASTTDVGVTWTEQRCDGIINLFGIAWSSNLHQWVVAGRGEDLSFTTLTLAYSSDGATWHKVTQNPFEFIGAPPFTASSGLAVTWSSFLGLWLAFGYSAFGSATSSDGISWASHDFTARYAEWSSDLNRFVAVTNSSVVYTSTDGSSWESNPIEHLILADNFDGTDIVWSSELHQFVMVGSGIYHDPSAVPLTSSFCANAGIGTFDPPTVSGIDPTLPPTYYFEPH